jgi:hypothetical protein
VARSNVALWMLGEASTILWFVFVYYDQHVQPWINAAIPRCHKIEKNLRQQGYDLYLHAWIKYERDESDKVDFKRERKQVGAIWVIRLFSVLVPLMWIVRLEFV